MRLSLQLICLLLFNNLIFGQSNNKPLVFSGFESQCLLGIQPDKIVAFKFRSNWTQVPVQIDEKQTKDIIAPYGPYYTMFSPQYHAPTNVKRLFYCDPNSYVGADSNPNFDVDDELVLRFSDGGVEISNFTFPAGVIPGKYCKVSMYDSLNLILKYIYLFESDGSLSSDANLNYVDYQMDSIISSSYLTNFNLLDSATNYETSKIITSSYELEYESEWINNQVKIFKGNATGLNIIDRNEVFINHPGSCIRSAEIISNGQNAFIANIDGPIRAIRSIMGAKSGITTTRVNYFYEHMSETHTDVRVHPGIESFYNVYDYNSNIFGLEYLNSNNLSAIPIDGISDTIELAMPNWEMVTGPHGSYLTVHNYQTKDIDISNFGISAYYEDNNVNPTRTCFGDGLAYGTSGIKIELPDLSYCTDQILCADPPALKIIKQNYYFEPNKLASDAIDLIDSERNVILASVSNFDSLACPNIVIAPGSHYINENLEANNHLLLLGEVPKNCTLNGKASSSIFVGFEFEVEKGAELLLEIDNCN